MGPLIELLIIGVLIMVTGVFVAAEIALVTVRRSRLQQLIDEGDKRARRVDRLISQPGRFLAVLQLVITFVGFLAAAFAGRASPRPSPTGWRRCWAPAPPAVSRSSW